MVDTAIKPVTTTLVKDLVAKLFDAYETHDADKVLALFTDDVVWRESGVGELHGKAAVKEHLVSLFIALPDMRFRGRTLYVSVDGATGGSHWSCIGTMTGPLTPPGYAPTNQKIEYEGACFYEFTDGLIAKHTVIYDLMEIGRQIGALPKEGSFTDKLGVRLQHFAAKRVHQN